VGVEKGTKAVIAVNFSVYGRRTFNNLQTNFAAEIPKKRVFQHARLTSTIELLSQAGDYHLVGMN
jgi:hypothetical protein